MKPSVKAWCASLIVVAASYAGQAFSAASAEEVNVAMSAAEASLAEASKLDSVWAIWDKGVLAEEDAPSLDEIMDAAREKQKAGDLDEALRMAKVVDFYAKAGIEQAKVNAQAGKPQY